MQLTFRGCVYANPAKNAQEAGERDLTIDELLQMKLVGLPIRVEHGKRAKVGTIKSSKTDAATGYTTVDMEFDDTVEAHVAAALIEKGRIKELSLCHDVYTDNSKVPVEVSLVEEGARPNTIIFPDSLSHDDALKQYISRRVSASIRSFQQPRDPIGRFTYSVMSSEAAPVTPAVVPPVAAEPAAVSQTPVPVRAETLSDEPAAKRQAVVDPDEVDKIASLLSEEHKNVFYNTLANAFQMRKEAMDTAAKAQAEAEAIKQQKQILEAKYDATKTNTNSMARQLAYVMDDFYRKYTPNETIKNEDEANKIAAGLLDMSERHPYAYQHIAKMQVACSKANEQEAYVQRMIAEKNAKDMEAIRLQSEKQRQRFLDMSGVKVDTPIVSAPVSTPAAWMPAPVATPALTVAASVHGMGGQQEPAAQPARTFNMADYIRQSCAGFNGSDSVKKSDFLSLK